MCLVKSVSQLQITVFIMNLKNEQVVNADKEIQLFFMMLN